MANRRQVLHAGAGILATAAWSRVNAAPAQPKTLLVLGGTGFIGPHVTNEAHKRGWRVTHFNRRKRDPDGVPDVETLLGDRKGQLDYARGGEMLVPGSPADPIQVIDARDLAAWMMILVETHTTGIYNGVSPAGMFAMRDLTDACKRTVPNVATTLTWVPEEFLAKTWSKDEMGVPPWAPLHGDEPGFSLTPGERAQQTGLSIRPIAESMRDTYEWFRTLPPERHEKLRAGIDPQKEVDTLRLWHARKS